MLLPTSLCGPVSRYTVRVTAMFDVRGRTLPTASASASYSIGLRPEPARRVRQCSPQEPVSKLRACPAGISAEGEVRARTIRQYSGKQRAETLWDSTNKQVEAMGRYGTLSNDLTKLDIAQRNPGVPDTTPTKRSRNVFLRPIDLGLAKF